MPGLRRSQGKPRALGLRQGFALPRRYAGGVVRGEPARLPWDPRERSREVWEQPRRLRGTCEFSTIRRKGSVPKLRKPDGAKAPESPPPSPAPRGLNVVGAVRRRRVRNPQDRQRLLGVCRPESSRAHSWGDHAAAGHSRFMQSSRLSVDCLAAHFPIATGDRTRLPHRMRHVVLDVVAWLGMH